MDVMGQVLLMRAVTAGGNPNFGNVVFQWEAEGANGLQNNGGVPGVMDDVTGKIITTSGSGQISNAQARFGSTSYFLGTGGANVAWTTDWNIGLTNSDPWTIEFSAYQPVSLKTWEIITNWHGSGTTNNSWWIRMQTDGQMRLLASSTGTTTFTMDVTTTGVGFVADAWADICVEKNSSGKIRVYKDGVMKFSTTPANSAFWPSVSEPLNFGIGGATPYIDHIRITKGVACYDSDSGYTFVAAPFPTF